MKKLLIKLLVVPLMIVLPLSLSACDSRGDTEDSSSEQSADEIEYDQDVGDDTTGSDTDDNAVTDAEYGLEIVAGFPPELPIAEGTTSIDEHFLIENAYWGTAPERDYHDVITEFETALPEAGWEIVERIQGVAVIDDMMFSVKGYGIEMNILIEPPGGDPDEGTLVSYIPVN
jgi:hypothetical protein